jgi:Uma2 family endonuclease
MDINTCGETNNMAMPTKLYFTVDEYFHWEATHEERHEYINGEIFAMAGASENHNLVNINLVGLLLPQVRKNGCKIYANDMRVKINEKDYTYPDLVVACKNPQFVRTPLDTLINPTLIIEIMSPTTETYDRGNKFKRCRQIASLQEYIIIPQNELSLEQHIRQNENTWLWTEHRGADTIVTFSSIDCQVRLGDIFEQVNFDETNP